jgi:cold shock CspA family protein
MTHSNSRSGKVFNFFPQKGFGFLEDDETHATVFFHISQVAGMLVLPVGTPVQYSVGERNGKSQAVNVIAVVPAVING